jgi:hypothetical protein
MILNPISMATKGYVSNSYPLGIASKGYVDISGGEVDPGLSKLYGCMYLGLYANIYVKPAF